MTRWTPTNSRSSEARTRLTERLAIRVALFALAGWLAAGSGAAQLKAKPQKDLHVKLVTPTYWVKVGSAGDVSTGLRSEVTIYAPQKLQCRWGTDKLLSKLEPEEGLWRLRRFDGLVARPGQQGSTKAFSNLGSGTATAGTAGVFEVDLAPYLPPNPGAKETIYYLEVIGRTRGGVDPTSATSPGGGGTKFPPKELGEWSEPVVITYKRDTSKPTQFDFPEVYRNVTAVLDDIVIIDDQDGAGHEEYYIAGFVQELFRTCPDGDPNNCRFNRAGRQLKFAPNPTAFGSENSILPYFRELNPPQRSNWGILDGPYYFEENRWRFRLDSVIDNYPRRYTLTVSLIEEDAGDNMTTWAAGVKELGSEVRSGDLLDLDNEDLQEFLLENSLEAIHFVADGVSAIIGAATGGLGPALLGATAIAIIADAVISIVADMADDYYGTRVATLTLASNRVDEIHKLPGKVSDDGKGYILDRQAIQYKGPPAANAAAAWDGIVEIGYHWEFAGREIE